MTTGPTDQPQPGQAGADLAMQMLDLRDMLAGWFEAHGCQVPHRGLLLSTLMADFTAFAPDGTELEVTVKPVGIHRQG
jgi:hypothetical protein